MKPVLFGYHRPRGLREATGLLASLGEGAQILSGGQSLGPMLNYRLARPEHLVDIHRLAELKGLAKKSDGSLSMGAAVTHAQIEDEAGMGRVGEFLARVARRIAFRAIRTRGTIGGSLANAHPASDWPVVVCALDGQLALTSERGVRTLPARNFFVGQMETKLEHGEVLTRIDLPPVVDHMYLGYAKFARKAGEFADSISAAALNISESGRVIDSQIWVGAAANIPMRIDAAERELAGQFHSDEVMRRVEGAVLRTLPDAASGHAQYKRRLHALSVVGALNDAFRLRKTS